MGYGANLFSASTTFSASTFDIGSDLINALDFLGHNVSSTVSDGLRNVFTSRHNFNTKDIFNGTITAEFKPTHEAHAIWGMLGIAIMFFPGFITIPPYMLGILRERNILWKIDLSQKDLRSFRPTDSKLDGIAGFIFVLCVMLFYPIAMILVAFVSLINAFGGKVSQLNTMSTMMIGNEASSESFPQILLQCFAIANGYDVTTVQKITIFASFLLLARVAIVHDLMGENKALSFKQTMMHTVKRLPAHVATIMFRVSAFTLTLVFLREWAAIPICALYLELLTITYMRYQNVKDPVICFRAIWYKSISNLAVLNVYTLVDTEMDEGDKPSEESCRNFIILSSFTTFVHHVMVMTSIILLALYYPEYFQQEGFSRLIVELKPGEAYFFYAFGITYFLGIFSLFLCLHLSKNVSEIRSKGSEH